MLPQPTLSAGLILSPAAEPFPRRLVDKAKSGQFVEMRELLADNIFLVNQLEAIQGFLPLQVLGATRPHLWVVTSFSTWCYCFLGYMAISTLDSTIRDQLAYTRLIIRDALRHGAVEWMEYDRVFRQQAAVDPSLRWNTLHNAGPWSWPGGNILSSVPRIRPYPITVCTSLHAPSDRQASYYPGCHYQTQNG